MQTGMYNCKPNPSPSFKHLLLILPHPCPLLLTAHSFSPSCFHPALFFNFIVYFKSPLSPWMVFLMRRSIVVNHWSRRDIESNSLTASVNASLFCSSCASRSFCCNKTKGELRIPLFNSALFNRNDLRPTYTKVKIDHQKFWIFFLIILWLYTRQQIRKK